MLRLRAWCGLLLLATQGGCGVDVYEARLAETNLFFAHREQLDRVLQGGWSDRATTIQMRVPRGFAIMARPAVPKEGEPEPVDERQPRVFGDLVLPGLVESWRADLQCDDGIERPALLYVCSNHSLQLKPDADSEQAPLPFNEQVQQLLANAFAVTLQPISTGAIQDNRLYNEMCPRDPKYAVPKPFLAASIVPQGGYPNATVQFIPKVQLYAHVNGQVEVSAILIYPANARERVDESLRTALSTFTVSNQFPKAQRPGGPPVPNNQPKF